MWEFGLDGGPCSPSALLVLLLNFLTFWVQVDVVFEVKKLSAATAFTERVPADGQLLFFVFFWCNEEFKNVLGFNTVCRR